jgi:transcriptional regulator with XRE-family HTH domain
MGMSQQKAAEALGISTSTLQQIERGVLPLSADISMRMLALSGAIIEPGLCRETTDSIAWDGSPYDANSLNRWRKTFVKKLKKLHEEIVPDLKTLIKVADRKGYSLPFIWAVRTSVYHLAADFRLYDLDILGAEEVARLMRTSKGRLDMLGKFLRGVKMGEYLKDTLMSGGTLVKDL